MANLTGLRPSTLRYYEQEGLIPPRPRISGRRRYDNRDLARLKLIRAARSSGLKIGEIRSLLEIQPLEKPLTVGGQQFISHKISAIYQAINSLEKAASNLEQWQKCGCQSLLTCDVIG